MVFGFRLGGRGRQVANAVADHLGIDHNLFDTAVKFGGFTWDHWKGAEALGQTVPEMARQIVPILIPGLQKLEAQFGPQDEIERAREALTQRGAYEILFEPTVEKSLALRDERSHEMLVEMERRFKAAIEQQGNFPYGYKGAFIFRELAYVVGVNKPATPEYLAYVSSSDASDVQRIVNLLIMEGWVDDKIVGDEFYYSLTDMGRSAAVQMIASFENFA